MMECTLAKVADSMHGVLHGADAPFRGVSTDTRTISSGELFFALQGPNFDACDFLDEALSRQAAAAVVARKVETTLPNISVADTRLALGALASSWRQQMPATVVGITGSNGKTTLKELAASCLSQSATTLATEGNLNNDIGLPMMLLRLAAKHRFAVIEMGASHLGEIEYLTSLAAPAVVVITNAGPAHLEGFGNVDNVAKAKGEILRGAASPKVAILNADDEYFEYWRSLAGDSRLLSFGLSPQATVNAADIRMVESGSTFRLNTPRGDTHINLPLQGLHNVRNACAAAAIGSALDLTLAEIRKGLESVAPVTGRLQPVRGIAGSRIFDDSYNANPVSVIAAAEFLAAQNGSSILVLADMAELGADAESLHASTGAAAKGLGIDRLLATGDLSRKTVEAFGQGGAWYASVEEINEDLRGSLSAGSNVLVKGSRSMRMGRVVRAIEQATNEARES